MRIIRRSMTHPRADLTVVDLGGGSQARSRLFVRVHRQPISMADPNVSCGRKGGDGAVIELRPVRPIAFSKPRQD